MWNQVIHRRLCVAVFGISVILAASCGKSGPDKPAPGTAMAHLPVTTADHESHFVGETVKGTIRVENTGTEPFRVVSATASCSCTTAVPSDESVAPGKGVDVPYQMTGQEVTSRTISIKLKTEPASKEPLVFTAKVVWMGRIEVDHDALNQKITFGQALNAKVPLRPAEGVAGLTIKRVDVVPEDVFSVGYEPSSEPGVLAYLVVQTSKKLQPGHYNARVAIVFDQSGLGKQAEPVTLDVLTVVQADASPIVVDFAGQKEVTIPVTLRHMNKGTFAIQSISGQNCTIRTPELPKDAAYLHTIPVTFTRVTDDPTPGFVVFDLGPELGTLKVPLMYVGSKRPDMTKKL